MSSDLARLRTQYGNRLVDQALQLSRQTDLRASFSISGERQRRHAERQSEREAQELFARKETCKETCKET
jgi:hypothetical protein